AGYFTAPVSLEFANASTGADQFIWDCGNGISLEGEKPKCRYLQSGRYSVQLKAIRDKDTSMVSKDIVVYAPGDCLVVMQTNFGNVVIRLLEETPLHRDQFIKLAES